MGETGRKGSWNPREDDTSRWKKNEASIVFRNMKVAGEFSQSVMVDWEDAHKAAGIVAQRVFSQPH